MSFGLRRAFNACLNRRTMIEIKTFNFLKTTSLTIVRKFYSRIEPLYSIYVNVVNVIETTLPYLMY